MLKSSILNIYEDNNRQLYDYAVQYNHLKQMRQYNQSMGEYQNWGYPGQAQNQVNPGMAVRFIFPIFII